MKCLNCRDFVTAHAFLTGWHLFTFFTVAPFLCIEAVIQKCSVKSCAWKFRKIHRKTPVPESLFKQSCRPGLFSQSTSGGCFYLYSIDHTGFLLHVGRFQNRNLGEFVWRTQVQTGSRGFFSMLQYSPEKLSKLWHRNIFFLIVFSCSTCCSKIS